MSGRLCLIEIGSNAVRAQYYELRGGKPHPLERVRYQLRLGEDVFKARRVSAQKKERLLNIFLSVFYQCSVRKMDSILAIATSALRNAQNKNNILQFIKKETGIPINIISGKLEATLVHYAICHKVKLSKGYSLCLDIGGGSTEVIIDHHKKLNDLKSFKLGTVRSLQFRSEEKLRQYIDEQTDQMLNFLAKKKIKKKMDSIIGLGGNFRRLGKLGKELFGNKLTTQVSLSDIESIHHILTNMDFHERIKYLGLREDRADVIVPATYFIMNLLFELKADTLKVPKITISDGVSLLMCKKSFTNIESAITRELVIGFLYKPSYKKPAILR